MCKSWVYSRIILFSVRKYVLNQVKCKYILVLLRADFIQYLLLFFK